jgi:hypothetical protein
MAKVLTRDAVIECPHKPGRVTIPPLPPPPRKLTIKGAPVLVKADLNMAPIAGCPQPAQTVDLSVSVVATGEARKVTVGQQPVLLDATFQATSDKTIALQVGSAGQDKLTAR